MRAVVLVAGGLLAIACPALARADDGSDAPAPVDPPPVTAVDGQARNLAQAPRPAEVVGGGILPAIGTAAADVFRVVLAPFRGLIYVEARWHTFSKIKSLFVNDAGTLGVFPTLQYTTDFGLSYGAQAFGKDFLDKGDDVELLGLTGGAIKEELQLKLAMPHIGGSPVFVVGRARYDHNDDLYFAGIGNPEMPITRYAERRFLGALSTGVELGHPGFIVRIGVSGIYNHRTFGPAGSDANDPSIETAYDTSTINGFTTGIQTVETTGDLELDWRDTPAETSQGGILRAFGGGEVDKARYGHYGAEATYFVAPFWPHRVLVARVALDGVVDSNGDIPFTELPRLGGAGLLRGFHTDEFRDKLAAIGTLEYHYPIHENLSGQLFVETGKVAGTYGALATRDFWHTGLGGGLYVHTAKSIPVRIDLAYGDGLSVYFTTDVLDAFRKREHEL